MNDPEKALQVMPAELMRLATDTAGLCKEIVTKTAVNIQGKNYVRVEGWMAIATAHGCAAGAVDVKQDERGTTATGEIRRISDGTLIARAEGFVGIDEPVWYGGPDKAWDKINKCYKDVIREKRADYAIRAMAQTRAISRVCRSAFAHVVVMMDAGLSTTPAEEVPLGGFGDEPHAGAAAKSRGESSPKNVTSTAPSDPKDWRSFPVPKFIAKWAGKTLGDMSKDPDDLLYWVNKFTPKPYQGKIQDADVALRAALDAAGDELFTNTGGRP